MDAALKEVSDAWLFTSKDDLSHTGII